MKVFIGWSGERSQALAQALRDWMPLVLHYVEPWLSEADVAAGERWAQSLAKELETSSFGIICVTRENATSPWILFEAGSLAKSLEESRVVPLLLDLEFSEISGPLAQFQAKKADKGGLYEVVQSINLVADQPVPEPRAKQLFDALWPELEKQLTAMPKPASATKSARPQHEILEELVAGVRSLDSRLREVEGMVCGSGSQGERYRRRPDPMMLRELSHMMSDNPGDPVFMLIWASLVRDQVPWLHEILLEAYRAVKSGDSEEIQEALGRLNRAVECSRRGPWAEEMGYDPHFTHILLRELEHFLMEGPMSKGAAPARPKRRSQPKAE